MNTVALIAAKSHLSLMVFICFCFAAETMKLVLLTGPFLGVRLALKGELHNRVSPCIVQRDSCYSPFTHCDAKGDQDGPALVKF